MQYLRDDLGWHFRIRIKSNSWIYCPGKGWKRLKHYHLGLGEVILLQGVTLNKTKSLSGLHLALDLFHWSELNRYPNRFPHLYCWVRPGSVKLPTLAERLLELLELLPGDRLVITPHHKPSDFPGVQVIGKGRDYAAILMGLQSLEKEMQARYERYAKGEDDFTWLNVCINEFPAIAANCGKDASEAMMILAREARKVKIRLIILSQGGEVKALGIEGNGSVVRECFTFIRLRGFAEDHAKRLKDGAIAQSIATQNYPCLVEDTPADTSVLAAQNQPPSGSEPMGRGWMMRIVMMMTRRKLGKTLLPQACYSSLAGCPHP